MMNLWQYAPLLAAVAMTASTPALAEPFSYQGRLNMDGQPANGTFDMGFELYASNNTQIGSDITINDVEVVDGLFTVYLDFGPTAFAGLPGQTMEIFVREGDSNGGYTQLLPRVPISTVPIAEYVINQEVLRDDDVLSLGASGEQLVINPDLSAGLPLNIFTDLQLNFDRNSYGGMYINGAQPDSIPFIGFARQNTPLAYIELPRDNDESRMNFVLGSSVPLELRSGGVRINGELLSTYSGGDEQISPVAFGYVSASGLTTEGTENYSVTWDNVNSRYRISITGETFFLSDYTVNVTPSGAAPSIPSASSFTGDLLVYMHDLSGNRIQRPFYFTVHRNDPK